MSRKINKVFAESLLKLVPKYIDNIIISASEIIIYVSPKHLISLCYFLRDHSHTQYKVVSDICGVDYPERSKRFEVVYNLLSIKYNSRIRLKVLTDELTPIPSLTSVFPAASWYEREVWDLYGIFFSEHPDLRRILTDYGFEGYPLRKDFPLSGYTEVRYDDSQKRVVTEPIEITQEFRYFDFRSPWEQINIK